MAKIKTVKKLNVKYKDLSDSCLLNVITITDDSDYDYTFKHEKTWTTDQDKTIQLDASQVGINSLTATRDTLSDDIEIRIEDPNLRSAEELY